MKHIQELIVKYNEQDVGHLYLSNKSIHFSYSDNWLNNGFNLSPFDLVWDNSLQAPADKKLFEGLHGVFADSISDGWGRKLTDRALQRKFNWEKEDITQLDRLFFMGRRSMGALEYFPHDTIENTQILFDLAQIFDETQKLIQGEKEEVIKELYLSGGSPGGARPKAIFAKKQNNFISGYGTIPLDYEAWLIKFFSTDDSTSMGKIEKAYSDMAYDCGVIMPKTELINVVINKKAQSFFAISRFDRIENKKIHVASLSGLAYASHREPSMSYKEIFNVTQQITKNHNELLKMVNVMIFNIIGHNKDDHTKNFSYYFNHNNWEVTPSYDMVYSQALGGEHMSDIGGEGNPKHKHMKNLLNQFDINATEQIEKTIEVISQWPHYAKAYNIPRKEITKIDNSLQRTIKDFNYEKTIKKLKV